MGRVLLLILSVFFVVDLYFISQGNESNYRLFTKPFLLPLLIVYYLQLCSKNDLTLEKVFVIGLVFSFFGDLFLLFDWGFIFGLGSFLIAHVLYIITFYNYKIVNKPILIVFILVYLVSFLCFLFPHLNEMKIPVIIYAIIISMMLYYGFCSKNKWLILGALLFVISDSILSFNLFIKVYLETELLVMITYVTAQFLLIKGVVTKSNELKRGIIV